MIRKLESKDIDRVIEIWFEVNKKAHDFIPESYWKGKYDEVKELLPEADIYVYEEQEKIEAFIGTIDNYIAGIFVSFCAQSRGVGKDLLNYAKNNQEILLLSVYAKNERARKFYEREKFTIKSENVDENTSEKEFLMEWKKS
ncbi:MAG: GNAT family N-acetyltransferase [Cetobacterium sp.]